MTVRCTTNVPREIFTTGAQIILSVSKAAPLTGHRSRGVLALQGSAGTTRNAAPSVDAPSNTGGQSLTNRRSYRRGEVSAESLSFGVTGCGGESWSDGQKLLRVQCLLGTSDPLRSQGLMATTGPRSVTRNGNEGVSNGQVERSQDFEGQKTKTQQNRPTVIRSAAWSDDSGLKRICGVDDARPSNTVGGEPHGESGKNGSAVTHSLGHGTESVRAAEPRSASPAISNTFGCSSSLAASLLAMNSQDAAASAKSAARPSTTKSPVGRLLAVGRESRGASEPCPATDVRRAA